MTAKDYVILAAALRKAKPVLHDPTHGASTAKGLQVRANYIVALVQWKTACLSISESLVIDNTNFDKVQFLTACDCVLDNVNYSM